MILEKEKSVVVVCAVQKLYPQQMLKNWSWILSNNQNYTDTQNYKIKSEMS